MNCGLDVTTQGVNLRASMFIKMVLEVAFVFPNIYISGGTESCR